VRDLSTGQLGYVTQLNSQAPVQLFVSDTSGQPPLLVDDRSGIDAVGGWSPDGRWLAFATQDPHSQTSAICLLPAPVRTGTTWKSVPFKCASVSGDAGYLAWESDPTSDRLSFISMGSTTAQLEELSIKPATAHTATRVAAVARSTGSTDDVSRPNPGPPWTMVVLLWLGAWWPRMRRTEQWPSPRHDGSASGSEHDNLAVYDDCTVDAPPLRVGIVSEALKWPPDEALKRIALAIVQGLSEHGEVLAIGTRGQRPDAEPYPVRCLRTNRAFLSLRLWGVIAAFRPNVLCYLPGSGLTTWSLIRALALRGGLVLRGQHPLLALVAVQPRRRGKVGAWLLERMSSGLVIVQSLAARAALEAQGCRRVHVLEAGVDLTVFAPVTSQRRAALRRQYGIPLDTFVVLHVGHLKSNRHLDVLTTLAQQLTRSLILIVGSTSTVADPAIATRLSAAGITILHRYLPHVEEVYQLADCYVFPVRDDQGSAQLPLSVLEALACELPVVTTRFGALPEYLPPSDAIDFCDTQEEFIAAVRARRLRSVPPTSARKLVMRYGWDLQVAKLVRELRIQLDRQPIRAPRASHPPRDGGETSA
ncbi:MAG TPA: glycosyltransferase family 4 protein, partial [Ktedonobacterales bacterium]|nr:glycosyltransferase family 4 protein [Ktedonobacterales bacterium]